jgi:hypothetical protein
MFTSSLPPSHPLDATAHMDYADSSSARAVHAASGAVHGVLPERGHRHAMPRDDFTGTQLPGRVLAEGSSLFSDAQRRLTGPEPAPAAGA